MSEPSAGLGDTVAKAIKGLTAGKVKPCSACERRRQALNRMVPYKRKPCSKCGDKAGDTDA
jgi:hypothetical protein